MPTCSAVHDSPKPPPTRISLGMSARCGGPPRSVFVATGEEKADAVARSVRGDDVIAHAVGRTARASTATTWYVDDDAAAGL